MYVIEGDRPSKNQLKMRRASRRMSIFTADLRQSCKILLRFTCFWGKFLFQFVIPIFTADLRKLKLKESRDEEEKDEEDTFNDAIDAFESGAVGNQHRERKISIIDP